MSEVCDINSQTLCLLKQGDEKAFEAVFRKYYAKIYYFVSNTLFDKMPAEDITQNVFLAVWEHRKNIIPEKDFSAYLYTIAKNLVFRETEKMLLSVRYENHIRQTRRDESYLFTPEIIDAYILEETVLRLVARLPKARKQIFLLHFEKKLSNREIAEKLSISVKNVEMQVRRSLNYIRKHLKLFCIFLTLFLQV
jgi:RNA polymerase sigma-70 factor (ECF subfamily)